MLQVNVPSRELRIVPPRAPAAARVRWTMGDPAWSAGAPLSI